MRTLIPILSVALLAIIVTTFLLPQQPFPQPRILQPIHLAPLPTKVSNQVPTFTARAVIVYDPNSAMTIFEKNADLPLSPASTTKMITALVVLEQGSLSRVVEVPRLTVEPQVMDLVAGERITIRDLVYGTLIRSANDAAEALAQTFPGGRAAFIKAMNERAQQARMRNSWFQNPTGLPESGHIATARDLALFAAEAMENQRFAEIVRTLETTVQSIDGKVTHRLVNLNELLRTVPGVFGIKTGWTEEGGGTLVTFVEQNKVPLIIVVLGSTDRFGDSKQLIEWAYSAYSWNTPGQQPVVQTSSRLH